MAMILNPAPVIMSKILPMLPFSTASGLSMVNVLFVATLFEFWAAKVRISSSQGNVAAKTKLQGFGTH